MRSKEFTCRSRQGRSAWPAQRLAEPGKAKELAAEVAKADLRGLRSARQRPAKPETMRGEHHLGGNPSIWRSHDL